MNSNQNNSAITSINKRSKRHLYVEIAQVLIERISSGVYKVGSTIPPENELAIMFGASRHTVRKAVGILSNQGLVSRRQGIGTIVTAQTTSARYTATLSSLDELLQHLDVTTLSISDTQEIITTSDLTELLKCPLGQRWIKINARRILKKSLEIVSLTQIYVQLRFSSIQDLIGEKQTSVYRLIEEHFNTQVVECVQEIEPMIINGTDAKKLEVDDGTPDLHITRHYLDTNFDILAVSVNRYPKNRFRFTTRWRLATR